MNTEEAIEFIEYIVKDLLIDEIGRCNFSGVENVRSKVNNIIELLKRGEKFEEMFRELEIEGNGSETFKKHLDYIKQKYFPKFKKTIIFTIEAPTANHLGTAINDFEMFWADYNEVKGHCIKYRYGKGSD